MSQRPDSVPHRPEDVSYRPGSVPQRPDFLLFWQDIQDISGCPGGVTARLRRSLAPCRSSSGGLAQSAKGRWLNARKRGAVATGHRVSPATKKPPLKCQHQQRGTAARSSARVTKTAQRPVDACSGSRSLLGTGGTERGSLTLEGRWLGFSFGVQLGFFQCEESARKVLVLCGGKRKETGWKVRFYRDSIAIFHDYSATLPIAEQSQMNSDEIATDSNLHTCRKRGCDAGRMCEVGPPASGLSFFTCPYSHLAVLNGNPALRGHFQAWAGG